MGRQMEEKENSKLEEGKEISEGGSGGFIYCWYMLLTLGNQIGKGDILELCVSRKFGELYTPERNGFLC